MKMLLPDGPLGIDLGVDPIGAILKNYKTMAVVGLSPNPARPSHGVASYLKEAGYRIIPVNPNESEVLGEKSYARVEDVPEKVEIVDIFRRPEHVRAVVEGAIRAGARVVWMQLDIVDEDAGEKARAAGLVVVMDACMLIEHRKRRHSAFR
jgi:uncharacterized protein